MVPDIKDTENLYRSLPSDIQEALVSVEVGNILEEIGKKHRLHVDQAGELYDETGLVMFGITHPKDYIRNLQTRLKTDADTAKKIAIDVNEQIFRPIRESLKKIHGVEESAMNNQKSLISNQEIQTRNQEVAIAREQTSLNAKSPVLNAQKEAPTLRLKQNVEPITQRGEKFGWPVKKDEPRSKNYESGITSQDEETKKTFFKVTPQTDAKREAQDDLRSAVHDLRKPWTPEQPKRGAPAPGNLPVESTDQSAPPLGTYPTEEKVMKEATATKKISIDPQTKKQTELGAVIKANSGESPQKNERGVIQDKLSGVFKLPRTKTEYKKNPTAPPAQKRDYGGLDPYREPID